MKNVKLPIFLSLLVAFFAFVSNSYADECIDFAEKFFQKSKKNATIDEHRNYLIQNIDTQYITKYSLGTKWRTLSQEQRKDFFNLYSKYVVYKYANQLIKYPILEYKILNSKLYENRNTCDVLVNITTIINEQKKTIPLTASLSKKEKNNVLIRDINIENISILNAQKQEIESLMGSKGYDGTIEALQKFISSQK